MFRGLEILVNYNHKINNKKFEETLLYIGLLKRRDQRSIQNLFSFFDFRTCMW